MGQLLVELLPCARITSIRFKGTFSVVWLDYKPDNTPSVCVSIKDTGWILATQSNTGDSTPKTLCSLGLVVVYCKNTFFSGAMMGMAPKAAKAHS